MRILKETSKSSEMIHRNLPKNEQLNPKNNPTLNNPFLPILKTKLSPIFSSPLENKQQNMKLGHENGAKKDKDTKNILKETDTLQNKIYDLTVKQKIYNDKLVQCLSKSNNKIY